MRRQRLIRGLGLFLLALPLATAPTPVDAAEVGAVVASPGAAGAAPTQAVDIAAEAGAIDALVAAELAKHGQQPAATLDDATFLRRIYLAAIGRIPTAAEAESFLGDHATDKRSALIARLVGSAGWIDQEFTWWADLLRVESQPMKRFPGEPFVDWLKQALRQGMPYDQMVRALITASGPALERGNGATGFYLRDAGMPLDNMSFAVQEFLGTRVACAQCHNHPFDTWTRYQYMQNAAYTAQVREAPQPDMVRALRQLARQQGQGQAQGGKNDTLKKSMQAIGRTILLDVEPPKAATIPLPKDYQYKDAAPNAAVAAHALFGDDIVVNPGQDPRVPYAQWMTSPANPRFTVVIANRLWRKVMGQGLIEPVDNFTSATVPSDPQLMDHLAGLMTRLGYDTRRYQQILLSTATFQRAAVPEESPAPEDYRFQGPLLRRMSAEEVWDSLLAMSIPDCDERQGAASAEGMYEAYEQYKDKTPAEIYAMMTDAADSLNQRKEIQAKLKDLMATFADRAAAAQDPQVRQLRQQLADLNKDGGGKGLGLYGMARRQAPETDPRWRGYPRELVRASELPSPAPPGHFLRDFGQSDRQLIDNASGAPAVTQALSMLNGVVDRDVLSADSELMRTLATIADRDRQLRIAFLAVLTRAPTAKERALFLAQDAPPIQDVIWTLINSREFLFVR
jgi:hypothetical protein